ncbi:MAG: recombinase family protein [Planctomycetota bacterium]
MVRRRDRRSASKTAKRVAVYTRSPLRSGPASRTRQERVCRDHAAHQGWKVVRVIREIGCGAAEEDSSIFEATLEAAKRGDFDLVVAADRSRLGRVSGDPARRLRQLQEAGVQVVFLQEACEIGDSLLGASGGVGHEQ